MRRDRNTEKMDDEDFNECIKIQAQEVIRTSTIWRLNGSTYKYKTEHNSMIERIFRPVSVILEWHRKFYNIKKISKSSENWRLLRLTRRRVREKRSLSVSQKYVTSIRWSWITQRRVHELWNSKQEQVQNKDMTKFDHPVKSAERPYI